MDCNCTVKVMYYLSIIKMKGMLGLERIVPAVISGLVSWTYILVGVAIMVVLGVLWSAKNRRKRSKRAIRNKARIGDMNKKLKSYEQSISLLSEENDRLLTEMDHRVKGNLQLMNSLINSQLFYIKNPGGREALIGSRHRVYALSLVHRSLSPEAKEDALDVPRFTEELADYLLDEYKAYERVSITYDMVPLTLLLTRAIPLALILNELLSNAFKFAFPGIRHGNILIRLISADENSYLLEINDNGIGVAEDFDFNSGRTLGESLITGLAQQMNAEISVRNNMGLKISISFDK